MQMVIKIQCEIPTRLFWVRRDFIVTSNREAESVRRKIGDLGGKIVACRVDHVMSAAEILDELSHEVRECNRVVFGDAVEEAV